MKKEITAGATKILETSVSFSGNIERISSQIVVANPSANITVPRFTQKVSARRAMPIGENVREAIDSIKGK